MENLDAHIYKGKNRSLSLGGEKKDQTHVGDQENRGRAQKQSHINPVN